jgi:hypothetical protein
MRAYCVCFRTEDKWAFDWKVLIIAEDVMSAMMHAQDHLGEIISKLSAAGLKEAAEIRISSLVEEYAAVTGSIGAKQSQDEWIANLTRKVTG